EQRALARAGRPHERHKIAPVHVEADLLQGRDLVLALAESPGHAPHFDQRHERALPQWFFLAAAGAAMPSVSSSPVTRTRAPSLSPSRPATITLSDGDRPRTTSTRSPAVSPRSTR